MKTKTIRTVAIRNGTAMRILNIIRRDNGEVALHDPIDANTDSLQPIADASDTSVADAIRENGWEIAQ